MVSRYRINQCWVFSVQQKNTKQVNLMFYFQNLKNTNANGIKRFLKKLLLELEFSP